MTVAFGMMDDSGVAIMTKNRIKK